MDLLASVKSGNKSLFNAENIIRASKDMSIAQLSELFHYRFLQVPDFYFLNSPYTQLTGFFRGRTHNHELGSIGQEFILEKEFWNTPAAFVRGIGRCNNVGESFLYCSNKLSTAIIESRPTVGEYITVTNFAGIEDENGDLPRLDMAHVGVEALKKMHPFDRSLGDVDTDEWSPEFKELNEIIDEIYQQKTSPGNEHVYKATIALTRFYLDMFSGGQPLHGMIYPSVLRDKKSYNILFWPGIAQQNFATTDLVTYKVLDLQDDKIDLEIIRRGIISDDFSPGQCFRKIVWDPIEAQKERFRIELFDHPNRFDLFTMLS